MRILEFKDSRFESKLKRFISRHAAPPDIREKVAAILREVEAEGDSAVCRYCEKFDAFPARPKDLRVKDGILKEAESSLSPQQRRHVREAIRCVRSFHEEGLPRSWTGKNPHGARVGERWYPVERVGIYIPAGNTPLVSTAVMTITLAKLAKVPSVAVFTPAREGKISPRMLAGLSLCGADEVYRVGGAHAVAAMAYGTPTIPAVCKIMGPGNPWVAEAQRQVFGRVGIDLIPGPSEAMVIADDTARVEFLAADLLAQAEHGSGWEKIYFVYQDPKQASAVWQAMRDQITGKRHEKAMRKVLQSSTLFIEVDGFEEAVKVANLVAPEHLELHVDRLHFNRLVRDIRTAGAILCGHDTPTVIGDFTAGPSHTLPTSGTGHFFSGLKITDFMRRSSIVQYDPKSLSRARDIVRTFAALEDLDAHGASMEIRFESKE